MPHYSDEIPATSGPLVALARRHGLKWVATQDAHYPFPDDVQWQEAVMCVRTNDALISPKRFKLDKNEYWFKPRFAVEEAFLEQQHLDGFDIRSGLDATLEIAERCTARMKVGGKPLLPNYVLPRQYEGEPDTYLKVLCDAGWESRDIPVIAERLARKEGVPPDRMIDRYASRVRRELAEIQRRGIAAYFLVVADLYAWTRSQGIFSGPGRGSGAGSLVVYLLNITQIDPIEHELLFERFLAPGRLSTPDLDLDFPDRDRDRIVEYLTQKYGEPFISRIGTITEFKGKQALKDVARIHLIPRNEAEAIAHVIQEPIGDDRPDSTYEQAIKDSRKAIREQAEGKKPKIYIEDAQRVVKFHEKYPEVLNYCKKIEGSSRNLGLHPAGIVIAPEPLIDLIPLEVREQKAKKRRIITTAFSMKAVEDMGLLKFDVLALKNLALLEDALINVRMHEGVTLDVKDIPIDDGLTFEAFSAGMFTGIFQFDTFAMRKMCEEMTFRKFPDITAATALVRPGTSRSNFGAQYLERMRKRKVPAIHPIYDEICKNTYGVPVYQEQFVRIFSDLAGYSPEDADELRRKCAKKDGAKAVMAEEKNFLEGCEKAGFSRPLAQALLTELASFGAYSFNMAHATSYAMTAYWQMYVKVHHAACYFAAYLANDEKATVNEYIDGELGQFGVGVLPPDVNRSEAKWVLVDGDLVAPIGIIKGVGPATIIAISEGRPYTSFFDFASRVNRKSCNVAKMKSLAENGALDSILDGEAGREVVEKLAAQWQDIMPAGSKPKKSRSKKVAEPEPTSTMELENVEEQEESPFK